MIRGFWTWLTTKCQACSRIRLGLGIAAMALFLSGVLMAGGAAGLAWTNTEKFCISCHEKRRYELATHVWTRMKQTDSLECRNCHHENAMDPEKQSAKARARHASMKS